MRRADKRDPWARLAGDHTAARATASTAPLLAIVLVISDSRCPQSQTPLLPTGAPWFKHTRNREGDLPLDVCVAAGRRGGRGFVGARRGKKVVIASEQANIKEADIWRN